MKSIKLILKIFMSSLIVLFGIYFFLISDYNNMFNNKRFIEIKKSIEKSKSKKYADLISIYQKTHSIENVNNRIRKSKKDCPCLTVIRNFGYPTLYVKNSSQIRNGINEIIYANKLEKTFTQEDCLIFLFSSYDFSRESKGVEEASKYFFNKNIEDLNQSEKINLILMVDNSALYNPLRNKELVKKKIEEYRQIINK